MYFPFLRGKQFELIALRESIDFLGDNVRPIIEPVKRNLVSLKKSLRILNDNEKKVILIANPKVGELKNGNKAYIKFLAEDIVNYPIVNLGFILSRPEDIYEVNKLIEHTEYEAEVALIHKYFFNLEEKERINDIDDIIYNIIDFDKTNRRYHRMFENIILLDDQFKKQRTNNDYLSEPDEAFSEEHLYYQEDGFLGFSDYLTIGEDYQESGFLPYAVAIHLTYLDPNNVFRIHHFVSNTNDDNSNVAGKYIEALEKLIDFIDEINLKTQATEEFRELFKYEHYPGLGTLKKLSVINHLELVSQILE